MYIAFLILAIIILCTVFYITVFRGTRYCRNCGRRNELITIQGYSTYTGKRNETWGCAKCNATPPKLTTPIPEVTTHSTVPASYDTPPLLLQPDKHWTIVMSPSKYLLNTPYQDMQWYEESPKEITARIRAVNKGVLNISTHVMSDNYSRVEVYPRTTKKT